MARIIVYPDELYHYGRLGMKWGKHIYGSDKSKSSGNAAKPAGQPKKTAKEKAGELASKAKDTAIKTFKDPAPVTDQFIGKSHDEVKAMRVLYEDQLAVVRAQAAIREIQKTNVSPAKAFVKYSVEKLAYPAIKQGMTDAVKSYTKEQIRQALMGEVEDPLPTIKRTLEMTEAKAKQAEAQLRYDIAREKLEARNKKKS